MNVKAVILGMMLMLLTVAPTASAGIGTPGNECNPGVIDFGCTYQNGDKTYDCTIWDGYSCLIDLSRIIHP